MINIGDYRVVNNNYLVFRIEKRKKYCFGLFYSWKCFLIISEDIWNGYDFKFDGLHLKNINKTKMILNLIQSENETKLNV